MVVFTWYTHARVLLAEASPASLFGCQQGHCKAGVSFVFSCALAKGPLQVKFPLFSGEISHEMGKIGNIAPVWEEGGKGWGVDDSGGRYVQEKGVKGGGRVHFVSILCPFYGHFMAIFVAIL